MFHKYFNLKNLTCYFDKSFLNLNEAGVPVTDLLVQRGYGIFDYLRVAGRQPLFLADHLDRFFNSATTMRLEIAESKQELIQIITKLIELNDLDYSGIRLIISGGDSEDGYKITTPRLLILQQPLAAPPEVLPKEGIKLVTHPFQRQMATVKTTDYLMAIYLQPWMKAQGGDDILYFSDDLVRECPRSNFFMVKNGVLVTPVNNMLLGITRKNIISLAADKNFKIEQRDITVAELNTAEEAFISSSTKRVTPVKQIDNYVLPAIHNSSLTYKIFEWLKEKEINL